MKYFVYVMLMCVIEFFFFFLFWIDVVVLVFVSGFVVWCLFFFLVYGCIFIGFFGWFFSVIKMCVVVIVL